MVIVWWKGVGIDARRGPRRFARLPRPEARSSFRELELFAPRSASRIVARTTTTPPSRPTMAFWLARLRWIESHSW